MLETARACAICLPPDFAPAHVTAGRAETAVAEICATARTRAASHRQALAPLRVLDAGRVLCAISACPLT